MSGNEPGEHRVAATTAWARLLPRLAEPELTRRVDAAGRAIAGCVTAGGRLLVAGNGGSAAMAAHVAAEFVGHCVADRRPLPAISLADSMASVTAVGNDYGFAQVFVRGVLAHGRAGDVLLAMSTSGRSRNVVAALRTARRLGLVTVLMTGSNGAAASSGLADHLLVAPTDSTPRAQEVHLLWAHAWCEAVDHLLTDPSRALDARPAMR